MLCFPTYLQLWPQRAAMRATTAGSLLNSTPPVSSFHEEVAAQGDVRKADDCERWVRGAAARFGRLDILVNCAAGNFLVCATSNFLVVCR